MYLFHDSMVASRRVSDIVTGLPNHFKVMRAMRRIFNSNDDNETYHKVNSLTTSPLSGLKEP